MQRSLPISKLLSPVALGTLLFIIYLMTLAPGLTWANAGFDGGDLITAAAVGGVAHPTGYPTYLLLARLFQLLPIGSLAYRTNLMSAVASAAAAALLCDFARRTPIIAGIRSDVMGWITGLAYGLAPLVWSQAVITEVYALQGLGIVAALWWLSNSPRGARPDFFFGVLLGLLPGIHLTALLLIPAFLIARALPVEAEPTRQKTGASLLRQLSGFGLGLLVYLILPWRASHHPAVNWGDAETLSRFWWQVSGGLYQDNLAPSSGLFLRGQLESASALLLQQAGLLGLALAALGLVWYFRPSRWILLTVWMFATNTAFAVLYHTEDSYIYLIPAIISFAIWLGWGCACLSNLLSRRWQPAGGILGALTIVYLLGLAAWHRPQVDASRDLQAENFAKHALAVLPQKAIVLANGDAVVFALWYEVFALKQRADLAVLAEDLLPFDWYRESLRVTYPGLAIPDHPDIWAAAIQRENASRPFCFLSAEDTTMISCRQRSAAQP